MHPSNVRRSFLLRGLLLATNYTMTAAVAALSAANQTVDADASNDNTTINDSSGEPLVTQVELLEPRRDFSRKDSKKR